MALMEAEFRESCRFLSGYVTQKLRWCHHTTKSLEPKISSICDGLLRNPPGPSSVHHESLAFLPCNIMTTTVSTFSFYRNVTVDWGGSRWIPEESVTYYVIRLTNELNDEKQKALTDKADNNDYIFRYFIFFFSGAYFSFLFMRDGLPSPGRFKTGRTFLNREAVWRTPPESTGTLFSPPWIPRSFCPVT